MLDVESLCRVNDPVSCISLFEDRLGNAVIVDGDEFIYEVLDFGVIFESVADELDDLSLFGGHMR